MTGSDKMDDESAAAPTRRRVRATYDTGTKPGGFHPSRRDALLGGAATWATVSLAGCSTIAGNNGGGSSPASFVVTDEIIAGGGSIPPGAGAFVQQCAPQYQFIPGMTAVFKVGVFDPATGEQVTNDTIDSMTVEIDRGASVELEWAGDDEENPSEEWSGSWSIPDDAETGTVSYSVEVSAEGEYSNFGILSNEFSIIEFGGPSTYVVEADTSTTSDAIPSEVGGFGGACGPQQYFIPGMLVVFHVGVWDPSTGERVGPDTIDSLSVEMENGETIEMEWIGDAEEHASPEWEGSWTVPDGAEPGAIQYTVQLQAEGGTMTVGVLADEIEIIQWPPEEEE